MSAGRSAPRWDYTADDHAELIAREREEDALHGNVGCHTPDCYDPVTMEYGPAYPCDYHRALELADIDRDGYDDKREPGWVA